MTSQASARAARVGDLVVVTGHRVGEHEQVGEIVELLGQSRPHYRVRWEGGRETVIYPGSDVTIRPGPEGAP